MADSVIIFLSYRWTENGSALGAGQVDAYFETFPSGDCSGSPQAVYSPVNLITIIDGALLWKEVWLLLKSLSLAEAAQAGESAADQPEGAAKECFDSRSVAAVFPSGSS
jgi:hypothetical protein